MFGLDHDAAARRRQMAHAPPRGKAQRAVNFPPAFYQTEKQSGAAPAAVYRSIFIKIGSVK
jgi:hypothetical protein